MSYAHAVGLCPPQFALQAHWTWPNLTRRADFIHADQAFRERLIEAFQSTKDQQEPSPYSEEQLYDGFFPREDEVLIEKFHTVPWEDRPALVMALNDPRLRQIHLDRLVAIQRGKNPLPETARISGGQFLDPSDPQNLCSFIRSLRCVRFRSTVPR